jgi:uncharacterized protein YdeI (YjbR/CyaY-like superfamily)
MGAKRFTVELERTRKPATYFDWLKEARRADTRRRRIEEAVAMLREGRPLR